MDPYDIDDDTDHEPDDPLEALADAADERWDETHPEKRAIDDDGRINTDLNCVGCGYNLRGQLPDGACPECGMPVADSNRSDKLGHADAAWLRTMQKGTNWLMIGAILLFIFACINIVSAGAFSRMDSGVGSAILLVLSTVQSLLFGVGYWLVTAPEPNAMVRRVTRPLARWSAAPGYFAGILANLLAVVNEPALLILSGVIQVLAGLAILFGMIATLVYLRTLARRIPDRGLAKHTTIVLWGWPCSISALILGIIALAVIGVTLGPSNPSGIADLISLAALLICPISVALVVFFIWWVVLISTYGKCFGRAARAARRNRRPVPLAG